MIPSLQTFQAGIIELEQFLGSSKGEEDLLRLLLREGRQERLEGDERAVVSELSRTVTNRRRYIYAVAIVSLYGLLERYVDSIISDYIHRLSRLAPSFGELPDAIRTNHFDLSIELARLSADNRYRLDINKNEIIANLHGCMSGAVPFQINTAAFIIHRGNITLQKISDFLLKLGVESHLPKIVRTSVMLKYLNKLNPERDYSRIPDNDLQTIFEPIEDLVKRRNEVSHGVVDDIESNDLLEERCHFVGAYGCALYEILMQEVISRELHQEHVTRLGNTIEIFGGSIVCFEGLQCTVKVGDLLIAKTSDTLMPFRFAPIESIQVDGVEHNEIALTHTTKVAIKAALRVRDNFEYMVLPAAIA
jgi:hypothetical protein